MHILVDLELLAKINIHSFDKVVNVCYVKEKTFVFQIKKGLVQTRSLPSPPQVTPPPFQHSISEPDDRFPNSRKYIFCVFFLKQASFTPAITQAKTPERRKLFKA